MLFTLVFTDILYRYVSLLEAEAYLGQVIDGAGEMPALQSIQRVGATTHDWRLRIGITHLLVQVVWAFSHGNAVQCHGWINAVGHAPFKSAFAY